MCVCICVWFALKQCLVCIKVKSDLISSPGCRWGSCFLSETLNHSNKAAITCLHSQINIHRHTHTQTSILQGLWDTLPVTLRTFVSCLSVAVISVTAGQPVRNTDEDVYQLQHRNFTASTKAKVKSSFTLTWSLFLPWIRKISGHFTKVGPKLCFCIALTDGCYPDWEFCFSHIDCLFLEQWTAQGRTEGFNSNKED